MIGREQDCLGGCFDSMAGSSGKVDTNSYREYGPQDFFGVMDEMRIWKTVRTQEQIVEVSFSSAEGLQLKTVSSLRNQSFISPT